MQKRIYIIAMHMRQSQRIKLLEVLSTIDADPRLRWEYNIHHLRADLDLPCSLGDIVHMLTAWRVNMINCLSWYAVLAPYDS
jgi:hypothetical protein